MQVKTRAFGETARECDRAAGSPDLPFATDVFGGYVDGGATVSHDIADAYLPYGRRAYVTLSPYPVSNFARELKHLLGYPHGCLEQTVSKAFPQIYLRDIATILAPSAMSGGSPTYFVNEAITKVAGMQLQRRHVHLLARQGRQPIPGPRCMPRISCLRRRRRGMR